MDVISKHGQTQIHNYVFGPNEGAGQKDQGAFFGAGKMKHNPPADRTLARPVIPLRLSQSCALNCLRASQSGRLKKGFDS